MFKPVVKYHGNPIWIGDPVKSAKIARKLAKAKAKELGENHKSGYIIIKKQ